MAIMALISLCLGRNPFLVHFASSICLLLAKMHLLLFAWGFLSTKEEPSVAEGGNSEKSWTNRRGLLQDRQKSEGGGFAAI